VTISNGWLSQGWLSLEDGHETVLLLFWFGFWILKQGLALSPRLASNLRFSCLSLLGTRITGMCRHTWPEAVHFNQGPSERIPVQQKQWSLPRCRGAAALWTQSVQVREQKQSWGLLSWAKICRALQVKLLGLEWSLAVALAYIHEALAQPPALRKKKWSCLFRHILKLSTGWDCIYILPASFCSECFMECFA
jgi:hypothetical protein